MPADSDAEDNNGDKVGPNRLIKKEGENPAQNNKSGKDSSLTHHQSHSSIPLLDAISRWKNRKNQDEPIHSSTVSQQSKKSTIHDKINLTARNAASNKVIDPGTEASDPAKLLQELERLGLKPIALERFIKYFHKFAVASGVSPEKLVLLIKEIVELSERAGNADGTKISIAQLQTFVEGLERERKELLNEADALKKKKESLELEIRIKELDLSAMNESISEFTRIKDELAKYGLSIKDDVSKLVELVQVCKIKLGYDFTAISGMLSDLQSIQDKKAKIELEVVALLDSRQELENNLALLENNISDNETIVSSIEEIKNLGISIQELEALHLMIKGIGETQRIDTSAARDKLFSDLDKYYCNSMELENKLSVLESLVQQKSEEFAGLHSHYLKEKALFESLRQLESDGLSEKWLDDMRRILDKYGLDLDSLAQRLEERQNLKASNDMLQKAMGTMKEEKQLLQYKLIALEEQKKKLEDSLSSDSVKKLEPFEPQAKNHNPRLDASILIL